MATIVEVDNEHQSGRQEANQISSHRAETAIDYDKVEVCEELDGPHSENGFVYLIRTV